MQNSLVQFVSFQSCIKIQKLKTVKTTIEKFGEKFREIMVRKKSSVKSNTSYYREKNLNRPLNEGRFKPGKTSKKDKGMKTSHFCANVIFGCTTTKIVTSNDRNGITSRKPGTVLSMQNVDGVPIG